jgi:hypothetical protein
MLEKRLNYISILSTENGITKSLFYDEAIKEYAAKKAGKSIVEARNVATQ